MISAFHMKVLMSTCGYHICYTDRVHVNLRQPIICAMILEVLKRSRFTENNRKFGKSEETMFRSGNFRQVWRTGRAQTAPGGRKVLPGRAFWRSRKGPVVIDGGTNCVIFGVWASPKYLRY